jgi:hypothetical protein
MIVDEGKIPLLNAQGGYLSTVGQWLLFTSNVTIVPSTTYSAVTGGNEASWGGYARVSITSLPTPTVPTPGGPAVSTPTPSPVFTNTSGSTVTFYGWALVDSGGILLAALNIGLQTLPNGQSFVLLPNITDTQA